MKVFQKFLSLFLGLLLILPALSFAEESSPAQISSAPLFDFTYVPNPGSFADLVSPKEAIEVAKIRQWGTADLNSFPQETLATLITEQGQPFWIITFVNKDDNEQVRWVKIDAKSGKGTTMDSTTITALLESWQKEKGPYLFWSVEELALFDSLYRPGHCIPRNVFPKEGDITQDEALVLAKKLLNQIFSLTEKEMDALKVSYYLTWGDFAITYFNRNEYVWALHFYAPDADEEAGTIYQVHFSADDGTIYMVIATDEPGGNG